MKIQAINFGAKRNAQVLKQEKIADYSIKSTPQALLNIAQQALDVTPTIKNASIYPLEKSKEIISEASEIQQKAQNIMSEIIDSYAYQKFCNDLRLKAPIASSYVSKIMVDNEIYDVKITQNEITALQRVNSSPYKTYAVPSIINSCEIESFGRDIYKFNTEDRELFYCAKNQRKQGYVSAINSEYFFNKGFVEKCNLGISKGSFNLINQSFQFADESCNHALESFSSRIINNDEKIVTQRMFGYYQDGTLACFARGKSENSFGVIKKELDYLFDKDGTLKEFKKGFEEYPYYWLANTYVNYKNDKDFYIQEGYDTRKVPEYESICFYQNGQVEYAQI